VAITRTYGPASSGWISGIGFAMAKTIGSRFMALMSLSATTPGPERPMKMSAPLRASLTEPRIFFSLVCFANHSLIGFMLSTRPS